MSSGLILYLKFPGVDLIPYLKGQMSGIPHKSLYWRSLEHGALRMGNWKIHRKKVKPGMSSDWALYNLKDDIGETKDLAADNPAKLKELINEWNKYNSQMVEPLW